ncbi:MAG TPA: polysaccharide deacetylase family protein [Clostridia bacterium]|nr:polysaccharide deacetylase family protein [Clostridia bacterium]
MKHARAFIESSGANAPKAAAAALCVLAAALSFFGDTQPDIPGQAAASFVNDGGPMIALTFDDGPYPEVTAEILDVLEEYGVTATFFVLGSRVEGCEEALLRMEALGCEVGNHTWSHANLTALSAEQCVAEIESTNREIERVLGHGAAVVRPPFGYYNQTVRSAVPYPLVLWTIDTGDWRMSDPAELARYVLAQVKEGCVILMHDQQATTAKAMRAVIPELMGAGFRFVTVSELIDSEGEQAAAVKFPP